MSNDNFNSYKMNKSLLWADIKAIGNPDNLKWSSKIPTMYESIQNYTMQQHLSAYESFFPEPVEIQQPLELEIVKQEGDGEKLKQFIIQAPANSIIKVNNKLFTNDGNVNQLVGKIFDELDYENVLEIQEVFSEPVEGQADNQVYFYGDSNCLITPIKNKLVQKLEDTESQTYARDIKAMIKKVDMLIPQFNKNGATPELIQQLADATHSKITVYEVISQTKRKFTAQKVQRKFKFKFQNISLNHVELWSGNNEQIIVENLGDIMDELEQKRQTYKFQIVNDHMVKINTGLCTYIKQEYKHLMDAENQINELTRDLAIRVKSDDKQGILQLILNTIRSSSGIKLGEVKDPQVLKHIDIQQSYSQFQSLPDRYKHGFAYLTDYRKVSSVDFAIQHNGFYKLQIISKPPKHISTILGERPYHVLASNIIQYLADNNVQMQIEGGIYGKHSKQISLPQYAYNQYCGRKAYYTAFSKYGIVSETITENICCPDQQLARIIQNNIGCRMIYTGDCIFDSYSIITKKEEKQTIKTRAHVYGYVLQCQMLNLMLQLEKMNMDRVKLIFGDDIYYEPHKFEQLAIFRNKNKNIYTDLVKISNPEFLRIPHFNEYAQFDFGTEEPVYYQYQLHQGPGGFGKTYARLQDNGSINQVYMTFTNKLVNEQKNSVFKPKCYTTAKFQAKLAQFKITATNIIIDEIGLCGQAIIDFIKKEMPYARIYVLGDELQIGGYLDFSNPFNPSLYDLVLDESNFKTDYRAKNCQKLQILKKQIRSAMRKGLNEQEIFQKIVAPNSQKTVVEKWVQEYNTNKMIITCSNEQKDIWLGRIGDQFQKYRVAKSFVHNGQQYFTGDVIETLPEGFDYQRNSKLKKPFVKKQFAFTCHSLQGCTHNNQLLVQFPLPGKLFTGFCYTAVSRLTKIEDLYTLKYMIVQKPTQE